MWDPDDFDVDVPEFAWPSAARVIPEEFFAQTMSREEWLEIEERVLHENDATV